jgi:hypothetical protein
VNSNERFFAVSGSLRGVHEIFSPLGCYVAHIGSYLPIMNNLSVPEKMGRIGCPETSVSNYQTASHNMPAGRRLQSLCLLRVSEDEQ